MPSNLPAPDEYFNDLSRQPNLLHSDDESPPLDQPENALNGEEHGQPRVKRIACVVCRKRKLKCNGEKPSCGTCSRLGHTCAYDEIRRKSGPKRGYVKELEARLAQVETQLKTKAHSKASSNGPRTMVSSSVESIRGNPPSESGSPIPPIPNQPALPMDLTYDQSSWEMIGLGLEEPLPTQEAIDELHEVYFDQTHAAAPMIHKYRYRAAMNLAPIMRPPVCLRYAMWAIAASVSDKYFNHQEIFYRRARKYAEADEMKGFGESYVTLGHTQCWIILASYEFKKMYFPRAWASCGRAARMAIMLGLHRLDGVGLDVKKTLPPPKDWTDREERRRTFWMAYCVDRYASIGTGWPMSLDEKDIMTNLPASEEAYEQSLPQTTQPLKESMTSRELSSLSSFAGVVLMAYYLGRNVSHLHRPAANEREDDLQGEFWKRHRSMDNALSNTALHLPSHLRLPAGVRNPNAVFLNMALHTSTICLHQAAIFKVGNNDLPNSIAEQSQGRCLLAATEIATTMRLTCHLDTNSMNPFIAFCLSVAARVFVQVLRNMPNDQAVLTSLEFLLSVMQAMKKKNPLSETFLLQLSLEIEGAGLDVILNNPDFSSSALKETAIGPTDGEACKHMFLPGNAKFAGNLPERIYVAFPDDSGKRTSGYGSDTSSIINYGGGGRGSEASASIISHGGTQYSVQNNAVKNQEPRKSRQQWSQSSNDDPRETLARSVRGWSVNPSSPPLKTGTDPTTTFDTNMSDNTSDSHRSSHPTPSSHSSFSPPQYDEPDIINQNVQAPTSNLHHTSPSSNAIATELPQPAFFSFIPEDIGFPPESTPVVQNQRSDSTTFMSPQPWQMAPPGMSGPITSAGQVPDENWTQISSNMIWDGAAISQENFLWMGQQSST